MQKITLYSFPTSPFAAKVHCYLLYKRLPFELHYVNPLKIKKTLPIGHQVPALTIGDEHLKDSGQIIQTLEEKLLTPPLLLIDNKGEETVKSRDTWLTEHLLPTLFRAVYLKLNKQIGHTCMGAWRLGKVMNENCGLPPFLWLFWPLLLRQQAFVKAIILPSQQKGSLQSERKRALAQLELWLGKSSFLAGDQVSIADLSGYAYLALPYYLGAKGMDDFTKNASILNWMMTMDTLLWQNQRQENLPPLLPQSARLRDRLVSLV